MQFINVIITIGVASVFGGLIYIGKKLQILDDLKTTTDKIKTNVKVVSDFLTRNHENFRPEEIQGYSPLKLTSDGEKFVIDTGFAKVFEEHKSDFFRFIDNESPKVKYDVENASIKSIYALYDKEYMSFLKNYFYNNPKRNLSDTAPTLGVYVRDKYLSEHREITV